MAEHDEAAGESLLDKIAEKIHSHDSSSDSHDDKASKVHSVKSNVYRLFGRERPVHKVLGGGKPTFLKKSPPQIPEVLIPDKCFLEVASALRIEINCALAVLRDIALGRDFKMFLAIITGLWILSIVGNWLNFLTLCYISLVLLHSLPVVYDKYEDQIDPLAEKALVEIKKQYAVLDKKVLSKIPIGPFKEKKND